MSFRFGKTTRTLIKSPGVFIRSCGGPLVMLTLMLSPLLAATLRARTLLDPQPENSSTPFGRSIAAVGDLDGDDVPDRQWGTSTLIETNSFNPPANLCKLAVNQNGDAMAFQYYGLPSNTSLSLNGNAAFTGVIYAPNADFTLGGGGNSTYDFVGASVTKSVRMNGHFHFHYDESIANRSKIGGYVVYSWNEIRPN